MSINSLEILATAPALTGTNTETAMNAYVAPIPAAYLETNETPVVLTVNRAGACIAYLHATTGCEYIDAPVPTSDGSRYIPETRNYRDWDYVLRTLLLNNQLQVGDIVEVKASTGWTPVARLQFTEVDVASSWSRDGIRQPAAYKMVTGRADSKRYYGDGGYWCGRVTGLTNEVTDIVTPDLSRW